MKIKELTSQIIGRRTARLPMIEQKEQELQALQGALDAFDRLKSEIIDPNGMVLDGKYKSIAEKNPEMTLKLHVLSTAECRKRIEQALLECKTVHKRFSRSSINIAVIGKARVGKSEFLKAISNLSNYVIPAFSETDCTGAVSVIENKPGVKLEANLIFKTEAQICSIVQTYLDRILPEEGNRIVIGSMEQIRTLNMMEVNRRKIPGRQENNLVPYLAKFVDHYDEWAPLIQQHSATLYDEREIQKYVAQNNGLPPENPSRKNFFRYLAVDTCHISCTFDYQEVGNITLIDTVGFEDNAIGIEDEMIHVVNDKSDAVVFLLFPLDGAGSGVPTKISDIYGKIETSCRGKQLDNWLFWLINHAPNHPKTPNPRAFCTQALQTLDGNCWAGKVRKIVNVSNQEQVREEFLIPLLNTLTEHLDEIDGLYLQDLQKALRSVRKEYNSFCSAAKKLMDSEISRTASIQPQIYRETTKMSERLRANLRTLARAEKEKRNIPCAVLQNQVRAILKDMSTGRIIPSKDQLVQELSYEDAPVLYTKYCNRIRNQVAQRFAAVDGSLNELVDEVKNNIAKILYSDEGCRLGRILSVSDTGAPYEWLREFEQTVLLEDKYPTLSSAFRNIYQFQFSVKGFLTYEVRACLDLLDPELTDNPKLLGDNDFQTAENINFWLQRNLIDVVDELTDHLTDLFRNPHRAFFAIIKEFSDSVVCSENAPIEWNVLFAENYSVIWAEEYRAIAVAATAFGEWADMLNLLLERNSTVGTLDNV